MKDSDFDESRVDGKSMIENLSVQIFSRSSRFFDFLRIWKNLTDGSNFYKSVEI